ncbi:peptidylprolyl isomerase [Granulicella sp. dw_53]|uniref:peptidylprolyl isomerase n=1 Tax=Granulicella sp. dw_53 TaxID=2719792 RepID=UPI001BD66CE2|nr:peptidylprolyl isomerase [Granulicella sp. dw_53]
MTLRISQFAAVCGLVLLTLPRVVSAQAPRYQSPYSTPASAPQQPTAPLPAPAAITPNGTVVEDVVVRVNDQIISRSDLERSQQQLNQEIQQQGSNVSSADAADRQKTLLRDMIDQQLLLSRAKELGLNADAEMTRRLDEIRKQNKLDTMEDLEKAARSQGVSYEDFKSNIKNGILTQQVVRDEVGRRLQPTQGQEQAFYEAHKQEFEQPEQVRLSEILIPTSPDAKDDAVAQAKAKAEDISAKVKAGGKFEDLAKSYSGGPTASQGGDLGLFKRGALAKVLEDQTFVLKAGDATAPIRTRQGFVILKVTEHQASGIPPMKDVEPQIQEALYMQQMQPALRAYLTKLREEAYIDIKPGFVDAGASSKQTKPVFTAYTPPVVKKKKTQEKQRFDRGGRFSTANRETPAEKAAAAAGPATAVPALPAPGAEGASAASTATTAAGTPAAAAATPTTPTTTASNSKAPAPGKQKKIKKEKVRFGQAPRNSLPPAPQDLASDAGLGRPDRDDAATGPGGSAAPGAAIAPAETVSQFSSTSDPDPLAPKAPVTGKVRYSARAKEVAATKKAVKVSKAKEKAVATPAPADTQELATQKTQAAPLGLNGDTVKKKKKKREKGAPKERLQQKPKDPSAPAPEATPYRNPINPGITTPATKTAPASDGTTLPPANSSAPGAPPQGNTTPATPGAPIPTPPPN